MTLILIGLGWVAGLVSAAGFDAPWWMAGAWLVVSFPAVHATGLLKGRLLASAFAVAAALTSSILFRAAAIDDPSWLPLLGEEVRITGVVVSEPDRGETTTGYTIEASSLEGGGERYAGGKVLVFLHQYADYLPGDELVLGGTLELPPEFEDFSYRDYLAREGIFATMFRPSASKVASGDASLSRELTRARLALDGSLQRSLHEPEASLAAGIAFGRDDGLSTEEKARYNRSGLRHLVAVSGSNVALVTALTYALAIPVLGRRWAWLPALFTVAAYLGAAGLSASVLRAGIMAGVLLAGTAIGRPQSGLPALFAAVIGMTALEPRLAIDPGFQLSATATAGLITLAPWIRHGLLSLTGATSWFALPYWVCETIGLTVAAGIATTPIMWVTFGQVSIVSPVANVVVQPVFAVAFWASIVTAALGLVSDDLGRLSGLVAYYPLAFIGEVARFAAAPRWAAVSTPAASLELAAAAYAGLAAIAFWAYRFAPGSRDERRDVVRRRALASRLVIAGACGAFVFAAVPLSLLNRDGPGELVIDFLDIGQGDAALITTPHGRQILIDGGPSGIRLARELGATMPHWDHRLEAVILSHPQEDHVAGLAEALQRFEVGAAYSSLIENQTTSYREFRDSAGGQLGLRAGDSVEVDGVRFESLWPREGVHFENLNDTSLVVRVSYGDITFLFTGDAEAEAFEALEGADLAADVLKVPHHGSKTTPAWVFDRVNPALAVISAGRENIFGHPHPDTLAALSGIRTYRTDTAGRITIRTDGTSIRVATQR